MVNIVEEELKMEVREDIRAANITANIIPLNKANITPNSQHHSFNISLLTAKKLTVHRQWID